MVKKKIPWMIFFLVIAALSVWAVISQSGTFSLPELISELKESNPIWMLLAVLSMFGFIFFEGTAISSLVRGLHESSTTGRGLVYSAADVYFSAITPSASGGQPASAFFMIWDGIPAATSAVVLLVNLIMYTLSNLLFGILAILLRPKIFLMYNLTGQILIVFGMTVMVGLCILFYLLLKHKAIPMAIASFFIRIGTKLHLIRRPEKYYKKLEKTINQYSSCAQAVKGKQKMLFHASMWNILQRLSQSTVLVFIYLSLGGKLSYSLDIWSAQTYSTLGASTIPIPGAIGISDYLLLQGIDAIPDVQNAANLELLSRGLSFYVCILISIIILIIGYLVRKLKGKKYPHN